VELRILLSSIFGKKNPLGFVIFGGPKVPAQKNCVRAGASQGWRGEGEKSNGDMANLARIENGDEVHLLALSYSYKKQQQNNCLQNNCHRFSIP
jgi:hypothetical protein